MTAVMAITVAGARSYSEDNFRLPMRLDTTINDVKAAGPASKGMDSGEIAKLSLG